METIRSLCLLAVVALACDVIAQDSSPVPADPKQFHLFLLVGQSNMAGRGTVEPQDTELHPRVLMFNKSGDWVPAVDPLHFDKPKVVGVGLGRSFAIAYAEANPGVTVGLIPCAVGGSPIDSWKPGGYHSQTKSHPYDDTLARAKSALPAGTLQGILWHQGESDSKAGLSTTYERKLHELIARLRGEFDAAKVPFIAGQMGQFAERPWNEHRRRVDAAHQALPESVPKTGFVSSDGLKHRGDEVHFDSASYRELGRRYFEAFKSVK